MIKVSQRSVQDRFNVLKNNFAKRQREEERASGISPEISEVHECLEYIMMIAADNSRRVSSIKWSVLAHLKSQPRGQNFQAQIWWSVLAHIILDPIKIPTNTFK